MRDHFAALAHPSTHPGFPPEFLDRNVMLGGLDPRGFRAILDKWAFAVGAPAAFASVVKEGQVARRFAAVAVSLAIVFVASVLDARGNNTNVDLDLAAAERAALGLAADRATIEAILASGADVGTQQWGIVLTAAEEAALDLGSRAEFVSSVSGTALAYARSLATYGGAYVIQAEGGRMVINLTVDDAALEERILAMVPAESRGLEIRRVAHTYEQLVDAAEDARPIWRKLTAVPLVSVAVDEVGNGLKVGVAPVHLAEADGPAQELSARLGVSVSTVEAEPSVDAGCFFRHHCHTPFKSGIKIDNDFPNGETWGFSCTLGFHVRLANGDEQALTAGHCGVDAVSDWWHPGTGLTEELAFAATMYPAVERDIMRLNIVNDAQASDHVYYPNQVRRVTGARAPLTGEVVCASMARSDTIDCGVVADNWTDWESTVCGCQMWGASVTGISAVPGDSGSPVYAPSNDKPVEALGVLGQTNGNFAHVMSALNYWNASIIK